MKLVCQVVAAAVGVPRRCWWMLVVGRCWLLGRGGRARRSLGPGNSTVVGPPGSCRLLGAVLAWLAAAAALAPGCQAACSRV